MFTKALALDWAKRNVRVNTLAPGWVDTDLTHGLLEHDVYGKRLLDRTPLGRFATPKDMAGGVVFLASRRTGIELQPMHPKRQRVDHPRQRFIVRRAKTMRRCPGQMLPGNDLDVPAMIRERRRREREKAL